MVAEKRISKQGAHDADHLEEDDVDEGEGDVPDESLEPGTSKQESQEQSRYLFLIRESGASLVEICYRHHFQFYEAHSAFASCEFGHCDSHICQQKDIELLRTYFIYYTLKFLVSCWR